MYQMVQNAYKVTLVAAFPPIAFGMFWKGATPQGAVVSIVLGLASWILLEQVAPDAVIPPQLAGFLFAVVGIVTGSLVPQVMSDAGHPEVVDLAGVRS